jgi:decaprenylphospho-beta-D-erythro-pentofuranosid-2-ulose 2-reductase
LRNRFYKAGAHVLIIKPGFVDGPMTRDFKNGLLWAQPEDIAIGITEAIEK